MEETTIYAPVAYNTTQVLGRLREKWLDKYRELLSLDTLIEETQQIFLEKTTIPDKTE